jgi:hypothetical protein
VSDTIILASLSALNLVAVTVVSVVSHDIPGILATTLTTLIGATAGVAVTSRSTTGNATAVSPIPDAAIG